MKYYRVLSLLVCVVIALTCGCANQAVPTTVPQPQIVETICSNDFYTIVSDGSHHYLCSKLEQHNSDASGCISIPFPEFQTVGEMKQHILSGSLDETVLAWIQRMYPSDYPGYANVLNVNQFHDATYPPEITTDVIQYLGGYYVFGFSGPQVMGYMYCMTEQVYNRYVDQWPEYLASKEIVYEGTIDDRNANEYHWLGGSNGKAKVLEYELSEPGKIMLIREDYYIPDTRYPYQVTFLGVENGCYFYGVLVNTANTSLFFRPSEEYLLQFGMKPYIETETE